MLSLAALIAAYDLDPGDVVYVDTGVYELLSNLVLTEEESGVTFRGYLNGQQLATVLRRDDYDYNRHVFELIGADNVTLQNLDIRGGHISVYAADASDSDDLAIIGCSFSEVTGRNVGDGSISLGSSNDRPLISGNRFDGSRLEPAGLDRNFAVQTKGEDVLIIGNTAFNFRARAIDSSGRNARIEDNELFDSAAGIWVVGTDSTVRGNLVHDNTTGIHASAPTAPVEILVIGNTVFANSSLGINIAGVNVAAEGNVVHGNRNSLAVGIAVTSGRVERNRVYDNSTGIKDSNGASRILQNVVYSNTAGIVGGGTIQGNIVYASSDVAILVEGRTNALVANNTLYQPSGDALRVVNSVGTHVNSNIIHVADGIGIAVATDSQAGFQSDYNLLHVTGSGSFARWQDRDFTNRHDWFYELGFDHNSLEADPLFVDPAGLDGVLGYDAAADVDHGTDDDFHLRSQYGSFHGGSLAPVKDPVTGLPVPLATTFTSDAGEFSPGIDRGDLMSYYLAEPAPNGGRVNLGAYGNSPQAALSTQQLVQIVSPNGLEKFEEGQQVPIRWRSAGLTETNHVALINIAGQRVDNWLADGYDTGSYSRSFSEAVDTSGLGDAAAPESVYQTYIEDGWGESLSYHLPLSAGDYTIRLHFVEPWNTSAGQRLIDVFLKESPIADGDLPVVDDYDLFLAAGGRYKATVLPLAATAADDGLYLKLTGRQHSSYAYAILSAIEITADNPLGIPTPTVTLDLSTDTGVSWSPLAAGLTMDRFGRGEFDWTAGPQTSGSTALVRAVFVSGIEDTSDETLSIAGSGNEFYVNDASTAGDEYASAPGDNANSGKSPDQPMANLAALLRAYDLDPGDVVYVDTGQYLMLDNITLTENDSGVRILGPEIGEARFDRQRNLLGSYVFELAGADSITIENLHMTGAYTAVFAAQDADSNNVSLLGNELFGNGTAIVLKQGNDDATIAGNNVYASLFNQFAVETRGERVLISGNQIFDNSRGITVWGKGTAVTGNEVFANGVGIIAWGWSGVWTGTDRIVISGNLVRNNTSYGIDISVTANRILVSDNTVHGHTATSGIRLYGTEAIGNVVYDNLVGIESHGSPVARNRVFDNETGIDISGAGVAESNFVYSNSVGIRATSFTGRIENNLIYANANFGTRMIAGSNARFVGNTVLQSVGDALTLETSATNVLLRNNIFWVDAGHGIFVQSGINSGFDSQYNLFYTGSGDTGNVGSFGGVARHSLEDWYTATEQDLFSNDGDDTNDLSRQGDPQFVDIDGADNILGFDGIQGVDGGLDDNFLPTAGSPAIDRGDAWQGTLFDLLGAGRVDDAGSSNQGSPDYGEIDLGPDAYPTDGTVKNWRSNNTYWTLTLPFAFPFYNQTYTSVRVSTEGFLQFEGSGQAGDSSNTLEELLENVRIAPMWDNLRTDRTGDNIFVDTSVATQVTIRWDATNEADETDVNFAVTLSDDGRIRFDYGAGNTNLTPTVGISRGDGVFSLLSQYNGQSDLGQVNPVEIAPTPGTTFFDLGAFEFLGSSLDVTPPGTLGTLPAEIGLGVSTAELITQIVFLFSEPVNQIDANAPGNYELLWAFDGIFDNGNDVLFPLLPDYTPGSTQVLLNIIGGPLPEGSFRLTVRGDTSIHDLAGLKFDGDGDGIPGGNFVTTFTVENNPPVADAGGPYAALVGDTIQFDGSGSADLDQLNTDLLYDWDLDDDGAFDDATGIGPTVSWATLQALGLDVGAHTIRLQVTDAFGATDVDTTQLTLVAESQVVGRHIFYNNSRWDDPTRGRTDDDAVAPDKTALLPDEMATSANYTNYVRGINGIMVDLAGTGISITDADFEFKTGNDNNPAGWVSLAATPTVVVQPGAGVGNSTRITITFDDNLIQNTWLQVTFLANLNTGLLQPDVFYFGNLIGECTADGKVDAFDVLDTRNNPHPFFDPATLDTAHDFNRDQRVNAIDTLIARSNQTWSLTELLLIDLAESQTGKLAESQTGKSTAAKKAARVAKVSSHDMVLRQSVDNQPVGRETASAKLDWLYELDNGGHKNQPTSNDRLAKAKDTLLAKQGL